MKIETMDQLLLHILNKNGVTYRSIKSWMYYPNYIDEAISELCLHLCDKFKDDYQVIIDKFNNKNNWKGFISLYSYRLLQNNTSIFYRKYIRKGGVDLGGNDELLQHIEGKQTLNDDIEQHYLGRLQELDGVQIQEIMIRILSSKRAIKLFDKEQRDLFYFLYLSDPNYEIGKKSYKKIAEDIGISRTELMRLIKPIRKFLKIELNKLEEMGELDKYILIKD